MRKQPRREKYRRMLTDPDDDAPEPTPEERKAYKAASFMSRGIERTSLHPQLENKEG